eukprot:11857966-Karenia_brevis.AAC.1
MPSVERTEDCITERKRLKTGDCIRNGKVWYQNGSTWMKPEDVWYQLGRLWTNILVKESVPERFGGSIEGCKMTEVCLIEDVKSEAYLVENR